VPTKILLLHLWTCMLRNLNFARIAILLIFLNFSNAMAQLGVGASTPDASSVLDVNSTSKGFLMPRMTNNQMNAISSPAEGLMVYNTDASGVYFFNGKNWCSREDQISAFVDEAEALQLDNIKVQLSSNRSTSSLQIATVSGSIKISGTSMNLFRSTSGSGGSSISSYIQQSLSVGTTFVLFQPDADFDWHGSVQKIDFMDETNNRLYTVGCIIGNGYIDNFIYIKRRL